MVEEDDLPLVRQVLQAQEYWRLKGLAADVVVVNENPLGYFDAMQAALEALFDEGPWRSWRHRPGGPYLLRGERLSQAERTLLLSAARAVLAGDRGELAHQLDRFYPERSAPEPLPLLARRPRTRLTPVRGMPPRLPRCPTSCSRTTWAASPPTGAST